VAIPFAAGVDNNVYNTPEGISDQSASVTPTLQVVVPVTRRARIRANGGIVPQYFQRETTERYTDVFGNVRAEVDAGPLTAFTGIGGGRYRQRFTLEIDDRLKRHQSSDIIGATVRLGRRVSLTGSQTRTTSTFDPEASVDGVSVSSRLDRKSVTRHVDVAIPLTRKTTLVPFADFIEDRFLNSPPGAAPTVDSERYGIGLTFSELAFLNGNFALGVRHFGASEGVTPYSGTFVSASLSSPFIFKSRLIVSANRDVNYSVLDPTPLEEVRSTYVASTYRAQVIFELPLSLQARPLGGYVESKYIAEDEASTAPPREHGWVAGGALLRHFGRHLSLGVRAQYESRTSPEANRSYGGMAYGLAGEVNF
jgi:hypothetical protein